MNLNGQFFFIKDTTSLEINNKPAISINTYLVLNTSNASLISIKKMLNCRRVNNTSIKISIIIWTDVGLRKKRFVTT